MLCDDDAVDDAVVAYVMEKVRNAARGNICKTSFLAHIFIEIN